MSDFSTINQFGPRRAAHLALVSDAADAVTAASAVSRAASSDAARGGMRTAIAADLRLVSKDGATYDTTVVSGRTGAWGMTPQATHARRSASVASVAAGTTTFDQALLPMVLATGVSGKAAVAVAEAIKSNPDLYAQAERAWKQGRGEV